MNVMTRLVCSSFYLDEDAFEGGSNGDGAEFDEEVARLEARPACLDLGLLLGLVKARHLEHEQVEERVGHQRHRLVRRLEQREHRHRVLRVVEHVHRSRIRTWNQNSNLFSQILFEFELSL